MMMMDDAEVYTAAIDAIDEGDVWRLSRLLVECDPDEPPFVQMCRHAAGCLNAHALMACAVYADSRRWIWRVPPDPHFDPIENKCLANLCDRRYMAASLAERLIARDAPWARHLATIGADPVMAASILQRNRDYHPMQRALAMRDAELLYRVMKTHSRWDRVRKLVWRRRPLHRLFFAWLDVHCVSMYAPGGKGRKADRNAYEEAIC